MLVHTDVKLDKQELLTGEWLQSIGQTFRLLPIPLPFHALSEGDPLALLGSYLEREN